MSVNQSSAALARVLGLFGGDVLRRRFAEQYLGDVNDDDLAGHDPSWFAEVLETHWALGETREADGTRVVVRSSPADRSVVLLVHDDMPFLVDSVRLALARRGLGIHLMIHPMLRLKRDDGRIVDFPERGGRVEAWTLVEIDRVAGDAAAGVAAELTEAYRDVTMAVGDWEAMRSRLVAHEANVPERDRKLIHWLANKRFVLLGAARYNEHGTVIDGSQAGLLRRLADVPVDLGSDAAVVRIARSATRSTVYRSARLTCIDIDDSGGHERFFGLMAAAAYRESAKATPHVQDKVEFVLDRAGFPSDSHSGRELRAAMESFPRDDLFEIDPPALERIVLGIAAIQERQRVRVFSFDEPGRVATTCLVFVPRSRLAHHTTLDVLNALETHTGRRVIDHDAVLGASALARLRFSLACSSDGRVIDERETEQLLDEVTTLWEERVCRQGAGDAEIRRLAVGAPPEYAASTPPHLAIADFVAMARLGTDDDLETAVRPDADEPGAYRFLLYRLGAPITLSSVLPLLENLGLTVVDQRPFEFAVSPPAWIYDIGIRVPAFPDTGDVGMPERLAEMQVAFEALVRNQMENDGFNRLILAAGLTGRQTEILRAYAKYLRQIGYPMSQVWIETALVRLAPITRMLCELFDTRFDSAGGVAVEAERDGRCLQLSAEIGAALDEVPSLDDDRIGRTYLRLIEATLRTNAFRTADDLAGGRPRQVLALKLDPSRIPDMPLPVPMFEIFVCSPSLEGVHLRGGPVARGGLRASDRREDYRTEVLGLMKAQMVKNAVIVPVGAKGGFVMKQPPAELEARRAETVSCYTAFVRGLLDVTDNLVNGVVVAPPMVVRYDGDDPYLVVAADKGTATFSDTANAISAEYGFWLGDAFASGGSVGYDHKAMGITARGAWESVRRHARAAGKDADRDELLVVGIGDMSGDVFGNGLLRSPHVRLVAAFDHRHVFIDPAPDPAASFAERVRLFALLRSSWADYDPALISSGGGVWSRSAKSIDVSPEARAVLGVEASSLTPNALLSAILKAPVDLLWNGGIGTYVKASTESNNEVGDRANDAIRINGDELRCVMVAEGGNLGFTQRGRVEYARRGGLVNTDAIDNSAGVDCSDHEVNIKILLNGAVAAGELTVEARNELLASMTDEIADQVLGDNRAQTLALAIARRQAGVMVNVHARYIRQLEVEGLLNRSLEFLPSDKELADRQANGGGLTTPEFAVLLAYTKLADIDGLLDSSLPDDPYLEPELIRYFPAALRNRFGDRIRTHRLRREIVATEVANEMVNRSGLSFDHRLTEETGATVADVARAWLVARDVFEFPALFDRIESLGLVAPDMQMALLLELRRMVERSAMWLLRRRRPPLDIAATVAEFRGGVQTLMREMAPIVRGPIADQLWASAHQRTLGGAPDDLAEQSALWPLMHTAFDLVELADRRACSLIDAAHAYWGAFHALDFAWLWDAIGALPRVDRWQTHARAALRDDLLTALADVADDVLAIGGSAAGWIEVNRRGVVRVTEVFSEIRRLGVLDITTLSVALRQVRNLVLTAATPAP